MKKKHELLVPVGSYASLIAAINNGADAVYLAGKKFGARAFADNFSDDEIEEVIKLCHLYDVKVYITVNTLIRDEEINEALEYLKKIHKCGVDAVIMQDVGLINLTHQTLPNLEIHASTQMHNHSKESLQFLKDLGVKRVVFAREMSLDYLKDIKTDLEKEVFIHGSLCISYSGQCLFSSCILGRSGNRGHCAGMCRLPYKLQEDNKLVKTKGNYLLSPKDLCSVDDFQKLLESDIISFKIEGRMKSPAYVALVTRIYKKLMNQYENNEELKVDENDFELLKAIFNREYTKGYLMDDHDIINACAPNHKGIHLGNVTKVTSQKIKIKLDRDLKQFEGIRFKESDKGLTVNFLYDLDDNLINSARKGDVVYIDNFIGLRHLDEVMLTTPLVNLAENITKKIKIQIKCHAKIGENISLNVTDGKNVVNVSGKVVQRSINSPVGEDRIKLALNKTGETPFEVDNIMVDTESEIFVSIGSLNKLRREALEKLKLMRETTQNIYQEYSYKRELPSKEEYGPVINVIARNEKQIKACQDLGIKNIIVEDSRLMKSNYIYKVPRDKMVHDYSYDNLLVTDYASLDKYPNQIGDYYLNVFNHHTFDYLKTKAKSIMLSPELSLTEIKKIMEYYPNGTSAEVLVYGRVELMILKHCLLKEHVNNKTLCDVCKNSKNYFLVDRNNAKYPILTNKNTHGNIILHHQITDLTGSLDALKEMGITSYRVEFYDEDYNTAKKVLSKIIRQI